MADEDFCETGYARQHEPVFAMAASKPTTSALTTPKISELHARLLKSRDCLFFISWTVPSTSTQEWQLIRVAYSDTMSVHPDCIQDGKFLVDFYVLHHDDKAYYAPNQRYWLEYHHQDEPVRMDHRTSYHLVKPSAESELYARRQGLYPYRQWCYVNHSDVYIHGPFDFALNARGATHDRVSTSDWEALIGAQHMYDNEPPAMSPERRVSVHCTWLVHEEVHEPAVEKRVLAAPLLATSLYPRDSDLPTDDSIGGDVCSPRTLP